VVTRTEQKWDLGKMICKKGEHGVNQAWKNRSGKRPTNQVVWVDNWEQNEKGTRKKKTRGG